MKKVMVLMFCILIAGAAISESSVKPRPGKHKSHKKAKQKKSKYMYNFQH